VLARGYAIASLPGGVIVTSTAQVAPGDPLRVRVADGEFSATVTKDERRRAKGERPA
jgi:exodeoxyribonuclease VII large subunit